MGQAARGKSIIYALVLAIGMSLLFPEGVFSASRSFRRSGKSRGPAVHSRHGFESSFRSGFGVELGRVQGAASFQRSFRPLRFSVPSWWWAWVHWRARHRRGRRRHHPGNVLSAQPIQRTCPNRNIRGPTMGGRRSRRGDLEARVLERREATGRALAAAGKQPPVPVPSTRLGQSVFKSCINSSLPLPVVSG